jgi:hypothetical protein
VAPFNKDPYAEHWFAKSLGPDQFAERVDRRSLTEHPGG